MQIHLAGVVVLYHPDESVLQNIQSYLSDLDKLYVIDNSENPEQGGADRTNKSAASCAV